METSHYEAALDETSDESFPASDAPSFTPLHAGAPRPAPVHEAEPTELGAKLRECAAVLAPTLEERQELEHGRSDTIAQRIVGTVTAHLRAIGAGAVIHRPLHNGVDGLESLELELAGVTRPQEIVIIGAHSDVSHSHDNVSGMVATLELARRAAARRSQRTLRFVFFPRGELPRTQRRHVGSALYANMAHARRENIVAMVALECLGCRPPTLHAHAGQDLGFPTAGVVFAANLRSRAIADGAARIFREVARVPVDAIALPGALPVLRSLDHCAFWDAGYHAFAVTDTWPLRDRRFCTPAHSLERLDFRRMEEATNGLDAIIATIAGPLAGTA
jgi:hypothetical protein